MNVFVIRRGGVRKEKDIQIRGNCDIYIWKKNAKTDLVHEKWGKDVLE